MAAAAARPVHVAGQSNSNAGCQPTSTTVPAANQQRGPFPMMMPWMPMMMPPWMPMFGMLPGNKGTLMPPMAMPMALPGMMGPRRQAGPSAAAATAQKAAATPAAESTALKPSATAAAAAAAELEDEELGLTPDEEVTVEPDELAVFEKVAAMEREQKQQKQQQQQEKFERASSPSGSCHTTVNGGSCSAPCSPMSAMQPMPFPPGMGCFPFPAFPCMPMGPMPGCFPAPAQAMQQQLNQQPVKQQTQQQWQKQAQQLWKPHPQQQQGGDADAAPVPWTSFAADDCGDDLDKDLQELIMLPLDCMQQAGGAAAAPCADPATAAAAPAPCPAAAAKARTSSLKRIGSTASAVSAADIVDGVLGQSPANGSKAKRVLRIRNSKGSAPSSGSTGRIVLKGSTAKRNGSSHQQQQGAGVLGVSKGAVQKKVAVNTLKTGAISSSHAKPSTGALVQAPAQGAGLQLPAPAPQEQQQAVSKGMADEESLCLLGDLDSSLSGGDAMTAGVMPADDYWDSFMQEASDDGWDSLLGNNELDFVTAGL